MVKREYPKYLVSLITCLTVLFTVFLSAFSPVHALDPDHLWLRTQLIYEFEDGISGVSDDNITFESKDWTKSGSWYYYNKPVEVGQKVRFMKGVQLPAEWNNSVSGKKFSIIVKVQLSEVIPGETGWNANTEANYSQSFEVWNSQTKPSGDYKINKGDVSVSISEFQLDENGKETAYVNDKVVVPGEYVSKIVEFTIKGTKGGLEEWEIENPVKSVRFGNEDVNGKTVAEGAELTYSITVKNPANSRQRIIVTDTVDSRLTIVDTMGGALTGSVNGGTIKWEVDVDPKQSATVQFKATAPSGIEKAETIPNVAEAEILGKKKTTNKVIVSLGPQNPIQQLQQLIARQTGDASQIPKYMALMAGALTALIAVIAFCIKRRTRKKED